MVFMRNVFVGVALFCAGFFFGNMYGFKHSENITLPKNIITQKQIVPIPKIDEKIKNKMDEKENKTINIIEKNIVQKKEKEIEKKYSFYDQFEQYLNMSQYEKALSVYQNNATNDDIEKYKNHLFEYIQTHISQRDSNILALVNQFLEVEYDHPYGLYFKSQIYFQNENFEEAILLLQHIKVYTLERTLEKKVINTLDEYRNFYINKLQEKKDLTKLIGFLQNIIQEDSYNAKYIYLLAKVNFELKNYNNAKELIEQILSDDIYENKAKELLIKINELMNRSEKFSKQIQLEKKGTHFFMKALLNDEKEVTLLLDTGASMTLIDESVIKSIEHRVIKENVNLNTAGGILTATYVELNSFSIEDTVLDKMQVVSSSIKNNGFDGLLGMNYLKEFDFYIDQESAILYLSPK